MYIDMSHMFVYLSDGFESTEDKNNPKKNEIKISEATNGKFSHVTWKAAAG